MRFRLEVKGFYSLKNKFALFRQHAHYKFEKSSCHLNPVNSHQETHKEKQCSKKEV